MPCVRALRIPAGAHRPAAACSADVRRSCSSVAERPGNREVEGSIPFGFTSTTSSLVRASGFQPEGSGFESHVVHQLASKASCIFGKPAASPLILPNIEAPAEVAAGQQAPGALCVCADAAWWQSPRARLPARLRAGRRGRGCAQRWSSHAQARTRVLGVGGRRRL